MRSFGIHSSSAKTRISRQHGVMGWLRVSKSLFAIALPVLLQLTVNGQRLSTSIEPRVTLLDALRNYLDVTGCKRVCDRGTCGACTVTIDGRTVYSCTTLALEARGADIRTVEGLAAGGRL